MICRSEVKLSSETKRKFHPYEVMQLKKKLTGLEQVTNMMKQELSHSTAERKTLMNDVYNQLRLLQLSLPPENQAPGDKFCKKPGRRSDGLFQVLYEDPNPSVVIRGGLGANSVAAPGASETTMSNYLCIEYNN
ncbi:hypothetical protein Tco_1324660 [Tanacetum coccineum]|uniref:Uncharacterized protein n=1 Tax=Tanacetum coccineum TaxID=301880 RepID=A0ABQ5AT69_9ASTR